ncbi:Hypothetical_protein [Hexamita inflata]|uniref:Hypothetical_protein n=1 Tax=Hexamita inflata TaxID=28002 RepID=A0AA86UZI9_9EUKA|nr:Hypothetical protein HINF_LOCUS62204 [Hexamita inflata]
MSNAQHHSQINVLLFKPSYFSLLNFILLKQQQHNDAVMAFELFKYSNMLVELGQFCTHLFLNYKKKLLQLYQSRTCGDSTELNTLLCLQKQLPPVLVCLAFLILKQILQKLTYLLNFQMTDEFEFTRKWTLRYDCWT